MAKKRDMLDDLIDIQSDWQALQNPLGDVANALAEDPAKRKVFDPAEYKEKPFANSNRCLCTTAERDDVCTRCRDVCPTDSITIHGKSVSIADNCRKCGLCVSVCPTEAIGTRRHTPRQLYDQIARAASSYNQVYVTCTRALKRLPKPNEITLACVGCISRDLWFSLLADYTNVNVYLPLGICDRCRTTTGEEFYSDAIATAEEWAVSSVGLEVEDKALDHELSREYKRSQFMSGAVKSAERLVTRSNGALAGAQAVANKISNHAKRLDQIQRELENAVGAKTTGNRQRMLTQNRKLMMAALQHEPRLARRIKLEVPACDPTLCTMCGDCVKVCPVRAIDLNNSGAIVVTPAYCVSCGACAKVCEDEALTMVPMDTQELVVPDKDAQMVAAQKAKAKAEAEKLMAQGKKSLNKAGDILEKLDK